MSPLETSDGLALWTVTDSARTADRRPRNRDGSVAKKRGRPRIKGKQDPAHVTRPEFVKTRPVHVVLRVVRAVGSLRTRHAYRAIRGAIGKCAARSDYRVVHASLQSNHLHLLVEADSKAALTKGMQGFAISAAKRLNRELRRRRGDVFAFRYHATAITSPTQARNAISYILNNWRHHAHDIRAPYQLDPYSSADRFFGDRRDEPLPCVRPISWLLTDGWTRAGPIYSDEVPGPDPLP